ncbi:hypothetical protein BC835DRAFT_739978 [Cytidiella melzeri]|nr:hypothetical protein BC835DRAFT_739978 [Cytidiella melzeri]
MRFPTFLILLAHVIISTVHTATVSASPYGNRELWKLRNLNPKKRMNNTGEAPKVHDFKARADNNLPSQPELTQKQLDEKIIQAEQEVDSALETAMNLGHEQRALEILYKSATDPGAKSKLFEAYKKKSAETNRAFSIHAEASKALRELEFKRFW